MHQPVSNDVLSGSACHFGCHPLHQKQHNCCTSSHCIVEFGSAWRQVMNGTWTGDCNLSSILLWLVMLLCGYFSHSLALYLGWWMLGWLLVDTPTMMATSGYFIFMFLRCPRMSLVSDLVSEGQQQSLPWFEPVNSPLLYCYQNFCPFEGNHHTF